VWLPLVAIAFATVVALVLFAPIGVEVLAAKAALDTTLTIQARFHWLGFSFPVGGADRARAKARPREPRRVEPRFGLSSVLAVLRSPGFVSRCTKLMRDTGRLALPSRVSIQGRIGFEDPADTGSLLGWLYACRGFRETDDGWRIDIGPDFSGPVLEGRFFVAWKRTPASVFWPLLTFLTSPVVWRAWKRGRTAD
jgi:hypothetical protein